MSEQNENRRKLLKSIAAGSGAVIAGKSLPESWSKPVVDSVMLPAHAQTSPSPCTPCLVAALYGEGSGCSGITVDVAIDGTVTVDTPSLDSPQTDTVDPCAGGAFSVTGNTGGGGSGGGTETISGTVECGAQTSMTVTQTSSGGDGPSQVLLTTGNCGG